MEGMPEDMMKPFLSEDESISPLITSAVHRETDKAWAVALRITSNFTLATCLYFTFSAGSVPSLGLLVFGMLLLGWLFARGMLHVTMKYSSSILQVTLFGFTAVSGVAAVSALATGHLLGWIVPALLCVWSVWFFVKHRTQIMFSSANLKVVAIAVKSMPWAIRTAFDLSFEQLAFVMVSSFAALGSMATFNSVTTPDGAVHGAFSCENVSGGVSGYDVEGEICMCVHGVAHLWPSPCIFEHRHGSFMLACFWLASLTWAAAFTRSLVSVAITASVTSWWISPEGDKSHALLALRRAKNGSRGSVCKEAAVARAARLPILVTRRLSILGRCDHLHVGRLRSAADGVLTYAIYFVGTRGLGFSEASRRVSKLFRRRGVTAIANDVVIDLGFAGLILGATALYMAAVFLLLRGVFDEAALEVVGFSRVFGTTVGVIGQSYLVAIILATMVEVLRSGFKAVFVCFLQDPEALAANHDREIYDGLSKAWRIMQAELPELDSDYPPRHLGCLL